MIRLKPMPKRAVPIFLVLVSLCALLGACADDGEESAAAVLSPEEVFWVEQYLRIVEARQMAADGDSLADGHFNHLAEQLPADSLIALVDAISTRDPQRWPLIFEEIVRRKKIMESLPR